MKTGDWGSIYQVGIFFRIDKLRGPHDVYWLASLYIRKAGTLDSWFQVLGCEGIICSASIVRMIQHVLNYRARAKLIVPLGNLQSRYPLLLLIAVKRSLFGRDREYAKKKGARGFVEPW